MAYYLAALFVVVTTVASVLVAVLILSVIAHAVMTDEAGSWR